MAVLQMQRMSVCALKKDRKAILETLQRRGAFEVSNLAMEDSVFQKTDTTVTKTIFEKNAALALQALDVLKHYAPEKTSMLSMLEGRKFMTRQDYTAFESKSADSLQAANSLVMLSKKIAENQAEILRLETQLESIAPWLGLDVSMRFSGTRKTSAFIGSFAEELTLEALYAKIAESATDAQTLSIDLISSSKDQTCVLIICHSDDTAAIEDALRMTGFIRPASPCKETPAEYKVKLESEIKESRRAIELAKTEIDGMAGKRSELQMLADHFAMRSEKYDVISRLTQSRNTFIISGYIPERSSKALTEELESNFDVATEIESSSDEDDVPVLLHNNKFSAPVESVIESYSLPGRNEIDPTTIMSFFYYILFGMMLSDAGYGLIMFIACGIIMLKYKNMESGIGKMIKMFFWCGLSTTFWGLMFGSFFGDAVSVIASTFFGSDLALKPLWFEPVKEPMRLLVFSFLMGIIHLFTGLALQFYQLARQGKWKDAIYDVVFWYMLVGGGIVYLLTMELVTNMMGLTFILPPIAGTIATVCAIVGAIGIVLTGGRESRNPFKRLLKGLYAVYNVTGYLSDILSYSRLLALGLATGVIATVFNKMGSMGGSGIGGAILFILVFAVGHTLNIGINLLGAYVHTNRLQFVEFFGKFYEGGGRAFAPFAAHTKYYKFKEEI